jgi:hypothetical protein
VRAPIAVEGERSKSDAAQCFRGREPGPFELGFTLADHGERKVSERSEISRGADRTARRDPGVDAARQQLAEELAHLGPCAAVPARQDGGAKQDHRAHDIARQ